LVFVLSKNKKPLNPCNNAVARKLLKQGKAVIHKKYPFTIRLKYIINEPKLKEYTLKLDPGAKITGVAIVENKPNHAKVVFLANLEHRQNIKSILDDRRAFRRTRRNRKTRYRKPRFSNRTRTEGWLPPSIQSIVGNIESWTKKIKKLCNITAIAVETVRFDTQLMDNPNIEGVEYQQGTLLGYELREYLLYKYGHECQYCKGESEDSVLNMEHMISKANGGSNRVSNLTLSCRTCNEDKGPLNLSNWLDILKTQSKTKLNKERIKNIEVILKKGLPKSFKDAAKVNSSRKATYRVLSNYTSDLEVSSGGRTKFNRTTSNLPKTHYFDALCVGKNTSDSFTFPKALKVLNIKAIGRGSRSRTNLNKYGFPRSYLPRQKYFFGFQTGDLVKAEIPNGKYQGVYYGSVACRSKGSFDIKTTDGKRISTNYKYFSLIQRLDGYNYGVEDIAL